LDAVRHHVPPGPQRSFPYIEELAELGIIGGALLVASIASMLIALAFRARGPERQVWAALLAGSVMWALHAGVDWDWQMPAVTAWFFAAGGLALAAPADRPQRETHPRVRLAVGFACLLLDRMESLAVGGDVVAARLVLAPRPTITYEGSRPWHRL
jgi:hypothetical protein